ncbi:MAG: hypothetical protein JKY37_28440 [Nannocystaceae bacterium]|nr:hypothetical protein [Nannocystaceae bacterium]
MRLSLAIVVSLSACMVSEGEGLTDARVPGDGSCGDLQCSSGLRVSLVAQGGVFVGGAYQVHSVADGASEVCTFRIEGEPDACGGDPPCLSADTCGLLYNFSALPHSVAFVVGPEPDVIEVGIVRDGETIGGEILAPTYEQYAPNGVDCPPVCQTAAAEVPVG